MNRRSLLALPALILVLLFVITGFRGVDYGLHWDEIPGHIEPVRNMARTGVFLPHDYLYPGLDKWLVLLSAVPGTLRTLITTHADPVRTQAVLQATLATPEYLLMARRVFIVVSSLAIVWVYGAVLALRRRPWEAFIAACGMGLSWEYAYHSRWVANDCILTQFSALTMFALALYRRGKDARWLYLAAAAVGLGTGAKQTGIFLFLPVILISISSLPLSRPVPQVRRGALLLAIVVGTFVLTTPGVLLEPFAFLRDMQGIASIYAVGHAQFTAASAWQHWGWVWTYLSVEFFSPYHAVSVVMTACAVLGAFTWLRRDVRFVLPLLLYPVVFLLVFCNKYVVMICRNYLQFTPILCVLAARGVATIFERLRYRWARVALGVALSACGLAQALFLVRAGESIRHVDYDAYVREAVEYVAKHPNTQFRVSERVRDRATKHHIPLPNNVVRAPLGQAVVMFGAADMGPPELYKENDPWLTDAVFGPREVNFNWYAIWAGSDHVVIMPIEKARAGAVPLAG
jgi:Dolichyl-phosphate-mannose-protein mannosyltransferase